MTRERREPRIYKHQFLIDDLNEMMINIKTHLLKLPINRPMPTSKDLDELQHRINQVLQEDSEPMIKH